jgi:hypothetical protein
MVSAENVGKFRAVRLRVRPRKAKRFSTVLRLLATGPDDRLTVQDLVRTFGDRAFGALMFLFAAPNLFPLMPPGASAVFGLPLIIISLQLAIGRPYLWLPRLLAEKSIRRTDLRAVMDRILPALRRVERLLSPRLVFLFGPVGDRTIGIICLAMAVILFLPIPFVNLAPALAIALFALAVLQRDGLLALVALFVSFVTVFLLVSISHALLIGMRAFFAALGLPFF